MKKFVYKLKNIMPFIIIIIFCTSSFPQQIFKYPGKKGDLNDSWKWAAKTARQEKLSGNFWIGYSFERLMGENSWIGSCDFDNEKRPSLGEMIGNASGVSESKEYRYRNRARRTNRNKAVDAGNSCVKVLKEVAVLFKCNPDKKGNVQIEDISLTNMTLPFDLEDLSLIWLNKVGHSQSIQHLRNLYESCSDVNIKEELITAIALHEKSERVIDFLKQVLLGREDDDLREKAAFWLGQQDDEAALESLHKVALSDPAIEVREKAVFGVYLMKIKAASGVLIDLARHANNREVRRKAIFWLSQKASHNVDAVLEEMVFNDEETEIQKHAVFALSQLPSEKSVPRLINVAKTHPNPKIRKKAIFWLGQNDDEKALEALVELVKSK